MDRDLRDGRKRWTRPEVKLLDVRRDTRSGPTQNPTGGEGQQYTPS